MDTIRTKTCDITRPGDAPAVAELDADVVGLVFHVKNKRAVGVGQAQAVAKSLPPSVSVVALSVNENEQTIRKISRQVSIDVIQFHGDEGDGFYRRFDRSYLKAVRVQSAADIQMACTKFPNARTLLFDTHHPTEYGGTGQGSNWTTSYDSIDRPWMLAGGLTAENVAEVVKISSAAAVDVSGDAEISGRVKSEGKTAASIQAAKVVRNLV